MAHPPPINYDNQIEGARGNVVLPQRAICPYYIHVLRD